MSQDAPQTKLKKKELTVSVFTARKNVQRQDNGWMDEWISCRSVRNGLTKTVVAYLRILFREQHLLKEFQETDSKTKNS
jgi:hypothetical protein